VQYRDEQKRSQDRFRGVTVRITDERNMKTIAKAEVPGLTKAQTPIQIAVLTAVSILTVCTLYMVPSWQVRGDPLLLAAVVGAVTVACHG
jgi:hypothetical protein